MKMPIRGIYLNVKAVGHGYPLVLMHGGPGADLYTLMAFKPLAKQFTPAEREILAKLTPGMRGCHCGRGAHAKGR